MVRKPWGPIGRADFSVGEVVVRKTPRAISESPEANGGSESDAER